MEENYGVWLFESIILMPSNDLRVGLTDFESVISFPVGNIENSSYA
jgi:hypothetical protein